MAGPAKVMIVRRIDGYNQSERDHKSLSAIPDKLETFKPASILEVIDAGFFPERDQPIHKYIRSGRCYECYYALGKFYRPTSILEIGVRLGYSLGSLIAGSGHVQYARGIDKQCYVSGSNSTAAEQIRKYISSAAVVDIRFDDSQKLSSLDREFDLIHVDGDHTQYGAMHDMELCLGKCKVMLVDDYDFYGSVRQAVDAFIQKHAQQIQKWYYIRTFRGLAVVEFVAPRNGQRMRNAEAQVTVTKLDKQTVVKPPVPAVIQRRPVPTGRQAATFAQAIVTGKYVSAEDVAGRVAICQQCEMRRVTPAGIEWCGICGCKVGHRDRQIDNLAAYEEKLPRWGCKHPLRGQGKGWPVK